jgi:hypothetical protein
MIDELKQDPVKTPIKELTLEQKRDYNRKAKAVSRNKKKKEKLEAFHQAVMAEVEARTFEQPDEPEIPLDQKKQFEAHSAAVRQQVESEIGRVLNDYGKPRELDVVLGLADASFGLEKKLILPSFNPYGVRCNFVFPETAVHSAIEFIRENPRSPLVFSQTFKALYQKALAQVKAFFNIQKNTGAADPGCWADIQREAVS